MNTLLINTASRRTQVALWADGQWVADERWESAHDEARTLLTRTVELLSERSFTLADVRRLICVVGPGGFTSVRIGASAVNAWAYAADLEVAEVTLFDLYALEKTVVFSANRHEAWVRQPGGDPKFVTAEELSGGFSYCGEVSEEWQQLLEEKGCRFDSVDSVLPDVTRLLFEKKIVKPWYYKEANITWSGKNAPSQNLVEPTGLEPALS